MGKNWDYAEHSKIVSEYGGVIPYEAHMDKMGILKGVAIMIPVCVAGCVFTYKKGEQVVSYFKNKFSRALKKDAEWEETGPLEVREEIVLECPVCGRKAYGMDEITVIFGYDINDDGKLEPHTCCKRCRTTVCKKEKVECAHLADHCFVGDKELF